MKLRILSILVMTLSFICESFAQKGKPRDLEYMFKVSNADFDKDFRVDSSDLRHWAEAVAHVYASQRPMMRMKMPALDLAKQFDKNQDSELSSTEERYMRDHLKKAMAEAFKHLLTKYDTNKNRRFDTKELPDLRAAVPNFTEYALSFKEGGQLPNNDKPNRLAQNGQNDIKPETKVKRKLDDIYD